jgi:hypothetical protein
MMNVIRLSVIMLKVVAPSSHLFPALSPHGAEQRSQESLIAVDKMALDEMSR